jgi:hypothetical protein
MDLSGHYRQPAYSAGYFNYCRIRNMFNAMTMPMKFTRPAILLFLLLIGNCSIASAEEAIKPFVLANVYETGDFSNIVSATRDTLAKNGFEIIGQYSPYADTEILVFTSDRLRENSTRSRRGGYGAVLRASVTLNSDRIELVFTNPIYWANAYRMENDLADTRMKLDKALGFVQQFGTGDEELSAADMRKYHYTLMMEYFDDPSLLAYYDSHEEAVEIVNKNLTEQVGAAKKVYRLDLGNDSEGKQMTIFGVGLSGEDEDDCSSDAYIMGRIDKSTPRHSAHLPYEILVYGTHVEALYGRFRIAISWPHLPMIASETGATFFSIMCAPGAIEDSLTRIAGGIQEGRTGGEK